MAKATKKAPIAERVAPAPDPLDEQRRVAIARIAARRLGAEPPAAALPAVQAPSAPRKGAPVPAFLADAAPGRPPAAAPVVLERVAAMVAAQRVAAQRLAEAELAAKRAKADLFRIESEDMPDLLREAGLNGVTLADGTRVDIADEISCSISKDRSEAAHAWLREHGYGALIKCVVAVAFGRENYKHAEALLAVLIESYGLDACTMKESVHNATLKSFLKERRAAFGEEAAAAIAAGDEDALAKVRERQPPEALFGVVPYAIAKISIPKTGRL